MSTDTKFTDEQLSDYERYERVRQSGVFNMLSPAARESTGLSRDRYLYVMGNYSELRDAFEAKIK